MKRQCWRCTKVKRLSLFPNSKSLPLGKKYECNLCNRKYVRAYRDKNKKKSYWQHRKWDLLNWKKKQQQRAASSKRHPKKTKANFCVNNALRNGKLKRKVRCFDCKKVGGKVRNGASELVADHYLGYAKKNWLKVQWVCRKCDGIRRRK